MMLGQIKAFAVDIDGVLVKDTFSPVIKRVIEKLGGRYSAAVEKNVFSQPQKKAAQFLRDYLNTEMTPQEILDYYFKERDLFINENPDKSRLMDGIEEFLALLRSYNARMVCYGGLDKKYFLAITGRYAKHFEDYICTNLFRPGIKEIVNDYLKMNYHEVLFFDDVNSVGVEAKKLGVPFIGVPSQESYGFQKADMKSSGIEYVVDTIKDIDAHLLERVAAAYLHPHSQ
jgi:beta-phosphoglucomutase-like phosphatase (HAD superfamily)